MSRRTLPITAYAGLSHVGHTLDEDLPRINKNYETIDNHLAQALAERENIKTTTSEANKLLGKQVNEKLEAESIKNAEKNTKLLQTVNNSITAITKKQEDFATKIEQEGEEREKNITQLLVSHESVSIESGAHAFPQGKEGQVLTIENGKYVFKNPYAICEFYTRMYLDKEKAFLPAVGTLISNADTKYPDAWDFLQTDVGKTRCVTEEEWQAMTTKVYYTTTAKKPTNEEQKTFSFDGIGGAPFFVQDLKTGTLRLPDVRGMYMESVGFTKLKAGDAHLDTMRLLEGTKDSYLQSYDYTYYTNKDSTKRHGVERLPTGSFKCLANTKSQRIINELSAFTDLSVQAQAGVGIGGGTITFYSNRHSYTVGFDSSCVVPTGNVTSPRAFGINYCVYLGNLVK